MAKPARAIIALTLSFFTAYGCSNTTDSELKFGEQLDTFIEDERAEQVFEEQPELRFGEQLDSFIEEENAEDVFILPTQDNETTNCLVDCGLLPEEEREIYPQN